MNEKNVRNLREKIEQANDRDALADRLVQEDGKDQVLLQRRHKEANTVARMRKETMAEAGQSKKLIALGKQEEGKWLLAQAQHEAAEDQANRQARKQRCLEDNAAMA